MTLAEIRRLLNEREKLLEKLTDELANERIQLNRDKLALARVMRLAARLPASRPLKPLNVELNPPGQTQL